MKETIIRTSGSITINGSKFVGKTVVVQGDGVVIIDGNTIDVPQAPKIEIKIEGDCQSVQTASGDVTVHGDVDTLTTTSGDVTCANVQGNVKTVSGDVSCGDVIGNIETISGDIVGHRRK